MSAAGSAEENDLLKEQVGEIDEEKEKALAEDVGKQLIAGKLGACSGKIYTKGRVYGWNELYGILRAPMLEVYNSVADVTAGTGATNHIVSGCSAAVCLPDKHGRPFAFELTIAHPSQVLVFGVDSAEEAEVWCSTLMKVQTGDIIAEGYEGNLTADQEKALADMRAALGEEGKDVPNVDLLRYLRGSAVGWDAASAATYYSECQIWRKQFNAAGLTVQNVAREIRTNKIRPTDKKDKQGRPIIVFKTAMHDPTKSSPVDVQTMLVYALERSFKQMGDKVDSCMIIIDHAGAKPKNVDIRVPKLCLETMQRRYPGRVSKICIVNAPWFFRFMWSTVRGFFNPKILEKVHILGSDMSTLQAFAGPESLFREHGGVVDWDSEKFIAKAAKDEGVTLTMGSDGLARFEDSKDIDPSLLASLKQLPAKETTDGAVKCGTMTKMGSVVKNWKARYFVLSEAGLLYYYKDAKSSAPQDVIMLERSHTAADASKETDKKHAFLLVHPLRTYVFVCKSDEEKAAWVQAIDSVLKTL